jgi:hypothetical protein
LILSTTVIHSRIYAHPYAPGGNCLLTHAIALLKFICDYFYERLDKASLR